MGDIVIVSAESTDFNLFWPIFHAIVQSEDTYGYDPHWTQEEACQHWFGPSNAVFFAQRGNDILGSYYIKPNAYGPASHVANAGFMVSPSFREKGVGRLMGEDALYRAKNLGFKAMQFNLVVSTNTRAVSLWQSLGFSIIGTTPQGFKHKTLGWVDTYVMHQFL